MPKTDDIIEKKPIQKQEQTGVNKKIEDSENNKYFKMLEEIFNVTGELPKDCPCKQYSKALYNRCVIQGTPKRGIRTVHKNNCNKIIEKIVLKKD